MDKKGNLTALTALKGLFILIIVLHNTLDIIPVFSGIPGRAFLVLFGGMLGNSMFFILSGFLLSAGYRDKIRSHCIPFRDYILRRLKKLYPLYLLSNAVMLSVELIRYGVSVINLQKVVFTLLLLGGPYNNPTWFLCALFVCYILFFVVTYFAKSPTHYLAFVSIGVLVGYILINQDLNMLFLGQENGIAYMNFFLGCILAEIYPLLSEKLHRWLQPLFLVLLPLLSYLMLAYGVEIIAGNVPVAFGFVLCPMMLYLALVKGPCSWILQRKFLVSLGSISSSIFFWHLVLYFIFCDGYALAARGEQIREPQYLLYFVLMIAFSAGFSKLDKSRSDSKQAV